MSASQYIEFWKDEAIYQMAVHHIPASITLAQGMLESGNGNSRLAREGNNHFGIKCHNNWPGEVIHEDDETRGECFRKYSNAYESFEDHSIFLKKPRYERLFDLEITDYKGWARGLKDCGYATNPKYPALLINLIETHNLTQYDKSGLEYIRENSVPDRRGQPTPVLAQEKNNEDQSRKKRPGRGVDERPEITLGQGRQVELSTNRIKFTRVLKGDSPQKIADDFDMNIWQIRKYNDLRPDQKLTEGEIIYLQPKRVRAAQESYTVKEGDTVWSVSQSTGVRVRNLCRRNGITEDGPLTPGQRLKLR